ncbi:MAG TPA: OmpA family protein [Chitinivibrionales bacterium]|nr:OmpA family protein [Chitinivibrionales bacterium]
MNTVQKLAVAVLFAVPITVFAAVDDNPISAGTSTGRNVTGSAPEAVFQNPALLGTDRVPWGGLLLLPITDYGMGYWSDKLALSPFSFLANIPTDSAKQKAFIKDVLNNSFDIKPGDSADLVSKKISDKLKGGTSIYSGFRTSLLSFAYRRLAFDVTTHFDEELRIPEAPFDLLFSPKGSSVGLQRGNTLDFSSFNQQGIWATDFTLQLGLPLTIPALQKFFHMRYAAGGVGVKYVMGHSMLEASSTPGSHITYDSVQNVIKMDGHFNVQTAGLGLHGPWMMDNKNPFLDKDNNFSFPINGHGIGVDAGGILYDDDAALSINIENLGVLFWTNNVKSVTYDVKKDNLDLYSLISGINAHNKNADSAIYTLFGNRQAGETFPTSRDTLNNAASAVTTWLPLSLNIGYARIFDFTKATNKSLYILADYANVAVNYEQQLTPGPGRSYLPRLSLGSEFAFLHNFLPLRMGFVAGGPEQWASALGMGLNFRYFSIQGAYKAIGNWWFTPSRGFEVAAGLNINWGVKKKVKKVSHCPFEPDSTFKGTLGPDGCPDPDQDKDSICDPWVHELGKDSLYAKVCHGVDKCPTKPEDYDGFEDEDGCPDFDNDKDGIPDSLDKCPNAPEDFDGFQDKDGCPDYDNDQDGVPDSLDKCPNEPEDIDGFEDKDGCPDYDNDKDGIPDTLDKCPNEPETYNGYKDDDGCPDTVPKPTAKEEKALNKALRAINFKTASAELTTDSYTALMSIANFLKQYPFLRYEVQGHTDSRGNQDYNLLLSAARAASVRGYLVTQQGIPDSSLIAIGYGKTRPIATNATAQGRALNRRVEFKVIDTKEDYQRLKLLEADFHERVKAAQIKGAKY